MKRKKFQSQAGVSGQEVGTACRQGPGLFMDVEHIVIRQNNYKDANWLQFDLVDRWGHVRQHVSMFTGRSTIPTIEIGDGVVQVLGADEVPDDAA